MISRALLFSVLLTFLSGFAPAQTSRSAPELDGTSPGERQAIEALCGAERSTIAYHMCLSNQIVSVGRKGRRPDLSVASATQKRDIDLACSDKKIPADLFACERERLAALGLPIRNEPGGGTLRTGAAVAAASASPFATNKNQPATSNTGLPSFSLEKWRQERPAMPVAKGGMPLAPAALYEKVAPSVYIVLATEQPIELAERSSRSQGSAVAISDHILLTNCHVVAGRPQIRITQQGRSARATLIYADPGSDRCFLRSEDMALRPVQGIRRFEDLSVGETVFSLGTPSGLELSFGEGLISGLRDMQGMKMIQNSAPSWHGSSGGGLFDNRGNLVGITTLGSTTVANLNFSIAAADYWP